MDNKLNWYFNMTINNEINIFKAEYNYGPIEQQIVERYSLTNFLDNLASKVYKPFIFPATNRKLDEVRVSESKDQLKAIGGKSLLLETPDGAMLDTMYLKARDFKTSIEKYFYLVSTNSTSNKSQELLFTLKPEFCTKEIIKEKDQYLSSYRFKPSDERAIKFLVFLKKLGFSEINFGRLPNIQKNVNTLSKTFLKYLESYFNRKIYGVNFRIHTLPKEIERIRSFNEEISSTPTAVISGGANGLYIFYKTLAAHYLIRGLDVILADFRGHGASIGIPTSYNTKLDLETVYQYLSKKEGIKNKDILLHGHCLGAGSSTDLAARRKGVNIIVDRSFSNINNLLQEDIQVILSDYEFDIFPFSEEINSLSDILSTQNIQKISSLTSSLLSNFVVYDNATNLSKIEGKVALVIATNDDIISEEEIDNQLKVFKEKTIIYTNKGHEGSWLYKERESNSDMTSITATSEQFNEFLIESNLYMQIFDLSSALVTNIAA